MTGRPVEAAVRRRGGKGRVLLVLLAAVCLLLVIAHLLAAWRLDTAHVQRRLASAIAKRSDSLYLVRIGSARFSLLGRSLRITDFELLPDTAAFTRRARTRPGPHTRYLATAASVDLDGLGLWRFFRKDLAVRSIAIDSLRVEVEVDRTKPRSPRAPAKLPHQFLQEERHTRIGQLRLTRSQVHFRQRASDGSRFGTLPFTEIEALISNVTTDPLRMSVGRPCEIDIHALFAGASRMFARFEYDLAAPQLNLAYHVSFGRMDARALNRFIVDLEGVRIREGQLDTAIFKIDVRDDLAQGELQLRYHDLEIETLDKVSRGRDLNDAVQSFLFNNFKLQTENPENDKPPFSATIRYRRLPETPIFKFIWLTLRDGIFQTLDL
ncbi:MAG TPA: DUF748 domain-containing protein [Gemmatimonadales bacterium]|jgi:hypothetical protein|nr:DUF748 domain-containing protein [Gemmatimonadales bacterium]